MPDKSRPTTIVDVLRTTALLLQPKKITCSADKKLGRLEAELLLGHVLEKDRIWLLLHPTHCLTPVELRLFTTLCNRRKRHEPIAYILGQKEFYTRMFHVTKDVLVPRPETELIIELVKKLQTPLTIWDVGTGSGSIAITLAVELSHAHILATDISSKALTIAKKNARSLAPTHPITFLKSNLLEPSTYRWLQREARTNNQHLCICANLPYLPVKDKKTLALDVTRFEPTRALYSGATGLDLMTKFLQQLSRHVQEWNYKKVTLLFEFDPPQAKQLTKQAQALFPKATITLHKDLAGKNRVFLLTFISTL